MTKPTTPSSSQQSRQVDFSRIWIAGLAAIAAAVVVNLIALFVMKAVLPLPAGFPPLQPGAIVLFTTVGSFLAVITYAALARFSARPAAVFTVVAVIALVVSILPNLALMVNPAAIPFPFPGASTLAFGVLIVFHVLAALACILILPRMTLRIKNPV